VSDVEDLLVRTLQDERRALGVRPGAADAVQRATRRLELRRRVAIAATAVATVAVIAGGATLADGGSANQGELPSYEASLSTQLSTQPSTTAPAAAAPTTAPQPSPTPAPATS
jgi:hypothetical protein